MKSEIHLLDWMMFTLFLREIRLIKSAGKTAVSMLMKGIELAFRITHR